MITLQEEEDRKEMDIISIKMNFQEFEGLHVFGNFDMLNMEKFSKGSSKWTPCYVYSLDYSVIFQLNYDKVINYMQKTSDTQQVHDKINFLLKNFPGLSQQITSNRDKVIQMFRPVTFT